jgi:2-dehydro-3-deoxyphosphooctonate aldolase (KDO 8-P synthase)
MNGKLRVSDQLAAGPGEPLLIIAGPCLIESVEQCVEIARTLAGCCAELGFNYIFKASFDKANRSSIDSPRGPGLVEGLKTLGEVRRQCDLPVTTDIHEPAQAAPAAGVADLIQIPAFLCRQTDLLVAAGQCGKPINVKKGQFMSPAEMGNVINKLAASGCPSLMLTERGTFFGYNRLVNDFVGLGDLMELGWPVCFDVTHSTQQPGGQGSQSGGRPDRAPLLARAAVAAGVDSLFIETHPDPAEALSDGATMLGLSQTLELLAQLKPIRDAIAN